MSNNIDEILKVSDNYVNEEPNHSRKDGLKDFARGNVNLRIGNSDYTAEIIIGNNGKKLYLYDVINLRLITIKERRSNNKPLSNDGKSLKNITPSKSSISQNNKNDNNILKLRIDINAGKVSETEGHNIMILTLSHELTHYAENFAHKEYADLQEFVFDALSKSTGKDIKELIAEEMEHQRRQNREHGTNIEVTESRAKSELVARGCELVLTDAETIRELAERNRGLFGKTNYNNGFSYQK